MLRAAAHSESRRCASNRRRLCARTVTLAGRGAHNDRPARLILCLRAPTPESFSASRAREIEAHWSRVDATHLRTRLAAGGRRRLDYRTSDGGAGGVGVDNALSLLDGGSSGHGRLGA